MRSTDHVRGWSLPWVTPADEAIVGALSEVMDRRMLVPIVAVVVIICGVLLVAKARQIRDWNIRVGRIPERSLWFRIMHWPGYLHAYRLLGVLWIAVGVAMLRIWSVGTLKL